MFCFRGVSLALFMFYALKPAHPTRQLHEQCGLAFFQDEFYFYGNGYATLAKEKFNPQDINLVRLAFKSFANEGLILLTGAPGKRAFQSLEIVDGNVVYQFDFGSGRVAMVSSQRYNDGKWHSVEAIQLHEDGGSLAIDGNIESTVKCARCFKSTNINRLVYLGGFKGSHRIQNVTEKPFNGSIRDLQLGNTKTNLTLLADQKDVISGCSKRLKRHVSSTSNIQQYGETEKAVGLSATYIGTTNLELSWKRTGCFELFWLKWNELNKPNETVVLETSNSLFEVTGLKPNTTYEFHLYSDTNVELGRIDAATACDQLSLIVENVTKSTIFLRWETLESHPSGFLLSVSGHNDSELDRTSHELVDLKPGSVYLVSLIATGTQLNVSRNISTTPSSVSVSYDSSYTSIGLTWDQPSDVEVSYKNDADRQCKLLRFAGKDGTIPQLMSGCRYQLNLTAVSNGRRSSYKSNFVTTKVYDQAKLVCETGDNEGEIKCSWGPNAESSCLSYKLNFSSASSYELYESINTSSQKITQKLRPGERISVDLLNKSGSWDSAEAISKPGINKRLLEDSKSTNNTIVIEFFHDPSLSIEYYNITCENTTSKNISNDETAIFDNLEAGRSYRFSANAMSQGVASQELVRHLRTVPNPPSLLKCVNETSESLTVEFGKPTNGGYDFFTIVANKTHSVNTNETTATIHSLSSYEYYHIEVKAVVGDKRIATTSGPPVTKVCRTGEGIPGKVSNIRNVTHGSWKVEFTWDPPQQPNGIITHYRIKLNLKVNDDFQEKIVKTENRRTVEFNHPEIEPSHVYRIDIVAVNSAGASEAASKWFNVPESKNSTLLIVAAVLLVILLIILIMLLVFYFIWKSPSRRQSVRRLSSRLLHVHNEMKLFKQPSVCSKPVKIADFLEYMKGLEKDSGLKFTEEYEDLKFVGRNQSRDEAEMQSNRVKNRFTNILPYDISRVKLLAMEDEEGSDYINANWIPGFHSKREFIASQGPLPSTINDFWRMIWENNCQAIVMLTLCIEKGHIKCEQYWPLDSEPVFYGDIKVEIQNENKTDEWHMRDFKISLGSQIRKIIHFHMVSWPDMYVPEKKSLIAFVNLVRDSITANNAKGPIAVHCSAGVGRTGTFIALDTLLHQINAEHDLDVYGIVFQMRMNRVLMVQTEAQYVFIYECVKQVLEEKTGQGDVGASDNAESKDAKEDKRNSSSQKVTDVEVNCDSKDKTHNSEEELKLTIVEKPVTGEEKSVTDGEKPITGGEKPVNEGDGSNSGSVAASDKDEAKTTSALDTKKQESSNDDSSNK